MKIYRVIPDTFTRGERINETDYIGLEDIYYNGGYISFREKQIVHKANTIYRNISNEDKEKKGKYFYLFPEDAVMRGYTVLNVFHNLKTTNFIIVEYDIPEDLILQCIGYGNYSQGITEIYTLECFITKDDIKGMEQKSDQISVYDKNNILMESLKQTIKTLIHFKDKACYDYNLYSKIFNVDDLSNIIVDNERIKEILLNSQYYKEFMKTIVDLVETPYITGKAISVNAIAAGGYIGWKNTEEYFKNLGLNVDYSEEQKEFKEELLYYLGLYNDNEDKEKAKALLKEKKFI